MEKVRDCDLLVWMDSGHQSIFIFPLLPLLSPRMSFLLDIILAAAGCCLPSSACQALMGGSSHGRKGIIGDYCHKPPQGLMIAVFMVRE